MRIQFSDINLNYPAVLLVTREFICVIKYFPRKCDLFSQFQKEIKGEPHISAWSQGELISTETDYQQLAFATSKYSKPLVSPHFSATSARVASTSLSFSEVSTLIELEAREDKRLSNSSPSLSLSAMLWL